MGTVYFIGAERQVEGIFTGVESKSIAHIPDELAEPWCAKAGVKPLSAFFSQSPEEAADFLKEIDADVPDDLEIEPEAWFSAADGLATIRCLIREILQAGTSYPRGEDALVDLREFEEILVALHEHDVRWHLGMGS